MNNILMTSSLFQLLDEQVSLCFTGRINILKKDNNQIMGFIILLNGKVVNSRYFNKVGIKGFNHIILDDFFTKEFTYVVEPEIIGEENILISLPYSKLVENLKVLFTKTKESLQLKPPESIQFYIDCEFIEKGPHINASEYEILCLLSDYSHMKDILLNKNMLDYELYNSLITLRKKGALKVIDNK